MKWSLRIAEVAGIGVFLHWTFLILLAAIVAENVVAGNPMLRIIEGVAFTLALFACVVFHELGHALAARQFGIHTRDITLLPIGGVARLERMPEDPWQELWVAVAGPAVNVAIAGLLLALLMILGRLHQLVEVQDVFTGSFLSRLIYVNLGLVAFNLLPAFPMDGGRVLRALLATRMPRVRATHIAAGVGQVMAIVFGVIGLVQQAWMLLFIAMFVYLGAQGEAYAAEMNSIFRNVLVRDAMTTRFCTLAPSDSLQRAADELLAGYQQDFPVLDAGNAIGLLRRSDLMDALRTRGPDSLVADSMCTQCPRVGAYDRLDHAVGMMHELDCSTLPVEWNGQLVGLLTAENIGEWAMIHSALRDWQPKQGWETTG
jgi:Zn-dependent protease/predicted transcriptional regulator